MLTDQGEPAADIEAAVNDINAHRKATAHVRTHAQHVPLVSHTFESFGIINPTAVLAFLQLVESCHGRSDFLLIEPDGRVMLASGFVEGSEAAQIGAYVAQHNVTPESIATEAALQIIIEHRRDTFKSFVVLPSGERIVGGNCFTEADARQMAQWAILAMRSTIFVLPDPALIHREPAFQF